MDYWGVIFSCFTYKLKENVGGLLGGGGGGAKGMLDSHLKILGSLPPTLFLRLCSLSSLGSQQPVRVADIVGWRKACSVYGKGWGPARALEKTRTIPVAERSSELMAWIISSFKPTIIYSSCILSKIKKGFLQLCGHI